MTGTILNVAGILIGGIAGLTRRKPLAPAREAFLKAALGAFTIFYGLRLTWQSLNGPALVFLQQLLTVIVALMLGKMTGRLLRLQKLSNGIGHRAREQMATVNAKSTDRFGAGFKTCAALFCAAPLGMLGSVQDGLSSYSWPLGVKAVMDGFATMGFVALFGWGAILSALPVLAFQGTLTLLCALVLRPFLEAHGLSALIDSVNAVGGLLVFSVALVVLGLKKIELADYLPSLLWAPLLTRLIAAW